MHWGFSEQWVHKAHPNSHVFIVTFMKRKQRLTDFAKLSQSIDPQFLLGDEYALIIIFFFFLAQKLIDLLLLLSRSTIS